MSRNAVLSALVIITYGSMCGAVYTMNDSVSLRWGAFALWNFFAIIMGGIYLGA